MRILSLNLWGGRCGSVLFKYLRQESKKTDIFCFQEVFDYPKTKKFKNNVKVDLYKRLKNLLPNFTPLFEVAYSGFIDKDRVNFKVLQGQAIFVRKGINIKETGFTYIYGNKKTKINSEFTNEPKILQYARVQVGNRDVLVVNVHGLWCPGDKQDTQKRLNQSKKIINFVLKFNCEKIICGDFNLHPKTQSIEMLEKNFINLIKVFRIKNTRNRLSWVTHNNIQNFADFCFVSKGIKVKKFKVPYNEVSDHLPLILEFY